MDLICHTEAVLSKELIVRGTIWARVIHTHMRLSKSRFVAGVQCLKRLYLLVHQPEFAAEAGEGTEAIMGQGQDVGDVARKAFPGGILVDPDHEHLDDALRMTSELVTNRDVPAIFEATFEHGRTLVRVDVLQRTAETDFRLLEVKSSTGMKAHYAYDIGIQKYVVAGAGLRIPSACLMHLNRDYVYAGGDYELSKLFSTEEIRDGTEIAPAEISQRVEQQLKLLEGSEPPDVAPGARCSDPFQCEFFEHCNEPVPTDHVSNLPGIRSIRIAAMFAEGISSIHDIPNDYPLSERQQIACDAVRKGTIWIGPGLASELAQLRYPLCFMDFETVYPALPRFAGMRPYDHIPFQWSIHRQKAANAPLEHYEFLAEDERDPRLAFIESLCRAVEGAATIVVYNQSFESGRLSDLARWQPTYTARITSQKLKVPPSSIALEELDAPLICSFLEHLETVRSNSANTRNIRLAAIRSFFRFMQHREPAALAQVRRVLAIPFKRTDTRLVPYLEQNEVQALLDAPDPTTREGIRDRAMLHLAISAGLRVSELTGLRTDDIAPQSASVRVFGKGRRERALPLWKTTASVLRSWLTIRGTVAAKEVFVNARGEPFSRWGIAYVLHHHAQTASKKCGSLASKQLSPHVLRHTCAMIILQATQDIRKVSLWLGHSNLATTEVYVRTDPSEKLEAIESVVPPHLRKGRFRAEDKLIALLKAKH